MITQEYEIRQVVHVPKALCNSCYKIANASWKHAHQIKYLMQHEVNYEDNVMFVCYVNDKVTGFIKGEIKHLNKKYFAEIDWLFVDNKKHKFGIGTKLLNKFIDYVNDYGVSYVQVTVLRTEQASNFYKKNKFEPYDDNVFRRQLSFDR